VKAAAIACALLSIVLLAATLKGWGSGQNEGEAQSSEQSGWRGGLVLFTVCLLVVASLWVIAADGGWPRDRTLWVGVGSFLAIMTLTRPWFFWENWKASSLRGVIGDDATILVYLAVAGAMVWVGLYTDWIFGRQ
jgi:hypothetical protein